MGAPSGGVILVGYDGGLGTQAPATQFVGNPDHCEMLMLENRYAGPLLATWADSDIQIGSGLIGQAMAPGLHIPPLSRILIPWPADYGVNFTAHPVGKGATLINNANTSGGAPNLWRWQRSPVKFWWLDAPPGMYGEFPLYPTHARLLLSRLVTGMVQTNLPVLHHVLPYAAATFASASSVQPLLIDTEQSVGPSQASPDARIMRIRTTVTGGTGILNDLEVTPLQELSGFGSAGAFSSGATASSFFPYGGTGGSGTAAQSDWFEIPGSVGVWFDNAGGAAASTLSFKAVYEVAIPLD